MARIRMHRTLKGDLEGEIIPASTVGHAPMNVLGPQPTSKEALIAENNWLRSVVYQKATHVEERAYFDFKRAFQSITPSTVAGIVTDISRTTITTHKFVIPEQLIYRWAYDILGKLTMMFDVNGGPPGLSKLKWIYQNGKLPMLTIILRSMHLILIEMSHSDNKSLDNIINAIGVRASKKLQKPRRRPGLF